KSGGNPPRRAGRSTYALLLVCFIAATIGNHIERVFDQIGHESKICGVLNPEDIFVLQSTPSIDCRRSVVKSHSPAIGYGYLLRDDSWITRTNHGPRRM